ncbi:SusD/RagB family nutrient-binding outer membrane lipoprotein [Shivajiella indica]|uniref:SusD/RagB family nutrient-binding outer membrane lipoprotein n=1 Tax=Shivajiella indica TaxID=872115 RepID=A0ABW5B498_9BACT
MRKILRNTIKVGLGMAILLSSSSCNEFFDINETPNNPVAVSPDVLLSTALAASAYANSNELNRFASTVMSVTAGASNAPAQYDIYNMTGADFGNQWRFEIYNGALINLELLIQEADKLESPAYSGIGKIMKAYTFALTTDAWGDIPYSEALKGEVNRQPKLDSQKEIYMGTEQIQSLFDLVKEGLEDLDKVSVFSPAKDDLYYGGNMALWAKAGESLLLKLANTISSAEPEKAREIIGTVLQRDNFIKTNADNMTMEFGRISGSWSPIYEWTEKSQFKDNMLISTRFVDLLQSKDDPRLPVYVTKPSGNYVTIDNGFRGALPQPVSSWSRFSAYVTGESGEGPTRLITAAQVNFILAESVLTLGTAGNAQDFFQEGIRRSMEDAGLNMVEIDAYFASNPDEVTLSGSEVENLEKIITQKYIALYGNGLEQWNDFRRTGFPRLLDHQNAQGIDGTRPVRIVYVDQELARNPNFKLVQPNVRVWWDIG